MSVFTVLTGGGIAATIMLSGSPASLTATPGDLSSSTVTLTSSVTDSGSRTGALSPINLHPSGRIRCPHHVDKKTKKEKGCVLGSLKNTGVPMAKCAKGARDGWRTGGKNPRNKAANAALNCVANQR